MTLKFNQWKLINKAKKLLQQPEINHTDIIFLNELNAFVKSPQFKQLQIETQKDLAYCLLRWYTNYNLINNNEEIAKEEFWIQKQIEYQKTKNRSAFGYTDRENQLIYNLYLTNYYFFTLLFYRYNLAFDEKYVYLKIDGKEYKIKKWNGNENMYSYLKEHGINKFEPLEFEYVKSTLQKNNQDIKDNIIYDIIWKREVFLSKILWTHLYAEW